MQYLSNVPLRFSTKFYKNIENCKTISFVTVYLFLHGKITIIQHLAIQIPYKKDTVSSTQFLVLDIYFLHIILDNIYAV